MLPTIITARPQVRRLLETPLGNTQTAALLDMAIGGSLQPAVSPEAADALVAAGFAQNTLGGFSLTDPGQVRAQMEDGL